MTLEEAQAQARANAACGSTTWTAASSRCSTSAPRVVEKIGRVKREAQLPVYEPKREDQVFANVTGANQGPLTREAVQRIFERIIDEMRTMQRLRMIQTRRRNLNVSRHAGRRHRRADPGRDRPPGGAGLRRASLHGRDPHRARRRGRQGRFRPRGLRSDGGRQGSAPHRLAVQAGQPQLPARRHGRASRRRRDRRRARRRDGRPVQRGKPRTRSSSAPSWWPSAGAKVIRGGAFKPRSSPYSFQGLGEEGLQLLREAADRHGLLVVSEVMDQTQIPLLARIRGHPAGGRAQHAELQSAARARQAAQAGAAEARHRGHHRGTAALRRIHPGRRQLRRDPVRARHPHLRNLHAQHAWISRRFRW